MNIFYSVLCILLIHISVNVNLRSSWCTRASYSETPCVCVCVFFLGFFFQSDRPTQYQETHSTQTKKRGMALPAKNLSLISAFQFLNGQASELSYG